jgi:hypothetical protein
MTATVLALENSRDQDGNDQPPGATVIATTGTVTVGQMTIVMTFVEMTIDETEMTTCGVIGKLTRTWKRMTQDGGEMTVNGMKEWLPDASENTMTDSVTVTDFHAKKAGNHLTTATEVGGLSWRSVMLAANEVLVVTEGLVL